MQRGSSPDMYTVLAAVAVVAMLAATAVLWVNASAMSPAGHPFALQEAGKIKFAGSR